MFRETARKIIDLWLIASNVAIYERGSLLEHKWYSILPMQASALHIYIPSKKCINEEVFMTKNLELGQSVRL